MVKMTWKIKLKAKLSKGPWLSNTIQQSHPCKPYFNQIKTQIPPRRLLSLTLEDKLRSVSLTKERCKFNLAKCLLLKILKLTPKIFKIPVTINYNLSQKQRKIKMQNFLNQIKRSKFQTTHLKGRKKQSYQNHRTPRSKLLTSQKL